MMAARGKKRKSSVSSRRETLEFYLFISPWLIGFVVFFAYPLISSLYYSFTRFEIGGRPFWIGLENYARMFADPLYLKTIRTTFLFALISVPGISMLALGLALILAQGLKAINAFRTIYFMPSVMPMVAISLTWFYVLRPETGPLAGLLALFGIQAPRFLGEVAWALPSLALVPPTLEPTVPKVSSLEPLHPQAKVLKTQPASQRFGVHFSNVMLEAP
jgi:multiple sugar transport system permease protein